MEMMYFHASELRPLRVPLYIFLAAGVLLLVSLFGLTITCPIGRYHLLPHGQEVGVGSNPYLGILLRDGWSGKAVVLSP